MLRFAGGRRHLANAALQVRGRLQGWSFSPDGRAQGHSRIPEGGAFGAFLKMRFQLPSIARRELSIQIGIDLKLHIVVGHRTPLRSAESARCNRSRARASRDMTVPSGTPVTSPISLYDIPSSSRRMMTSRNSRGRLSMA